MLKKILYIFICYSQLSFSKDFDNNLYYLNSINVISNPINQYEQLYNRQDLDKSSASDLRTAVRYIPSVTTSIDGLGRDQSYNIRGIQGDRIGMTIDGNTLGQIINGMGFGNKESVRNGVEFDTIKIMDIFKGPFSVKTNSLGGSVNLVTYVPDDFVFDGKNFYLGLKESYDQSNSKYKSTLTLANKINNLRTLLIISKSKNKQINNFGNLNTPLGFAFGLNDVYPQSPLNTKGFNILSKIAYDLGENKFLFSFNNYYDKYKLKEKYDSSNTKANRYNLDYTFKVNRKYIEQIQIKLFSNKIKNYMYSELLIPLSNYIKSPVENFSNRVLFLQNPIDNLLLYIPDNLSLYKQKVLIIQKNKGLSFNLDGLLNTYYLEHNWSFGINYFQDTFNRDIDNKGIVDLLSVAFDSLPTLKTKNLNTYIQDNISIPNNIILKLALKYQYFSSIPGVSPYLRHHNISDKIINIEQKIKNKHEKNFLPIVSLSKDFNDKIVIYSIYSNGIKNPVYDNYITFNHIFGWVVPNFDLKAEKSNNIEIGVNYLGSKLRANFDLFSNKYKNFIEYKKFYNGYYLDNIPLISDLIRLSSKFNDSLDKNLQEEFLIPTNVSKAKIYGSEFSINYDLTPKFSINFIGSLIKGRNEETKKNLQSVSPYKTILGIAYHKDIAFKIALDWIHSNKVKQYPVIETRKGPNKGFKAPSYNVFDLTFFSKLSQNFNLYGGIYNIFNKKYWLSQDVQNLKANRADLDKFTMPKRSFAVSLEANF